MKNLVSIFLFSLVFLVGCDFEQFNTTVRTENPRQSEFISLDDDHTTPSVFVFDESGSDTFYPSCESATLLE